MSENKVLKIGDKILLIGLGLMGGSYAKALIKAGFMVYALDPDEFSIYFAKHEKMIHEGATSIEEAEAKGLFDADCVVFAIYPNLMLEWIEKHQQHLKSGIIVTDISGVKRQIVDKAQELLRSDLEFIGAHPMCGKESYGITNSDDSSFRIANFIITPTIKNTWRGITFARELADAMGFYKISVLSPEEHDDMIGFLSQLTHIIAISLMNCNENDHLQDYTGDSFRDLTRIAKINERMWPELFSLNKDLLCGHIDSFINEMQSMKELIANSDIKGMEEKCIHSTARRQLFDRK